MHDAKRDSAPLRGIVSLVRGHIIALLLLRPLVENRARALGHRGARDGVAVKGLVGVKVLVVGVQLVGREYVDR